MNGEIGVIYLLHFSGKVGDHAQHYLGWAKDVNRRLKNHSAKLVMEAKSKGMGIKVVRTWDGTRDQERQLKKHHNPKRMCPECNPEYAAGRGVLQGAL